VRVFSTFVIFGHNGIGHAEILLAIAEHRHGEAASAMAHHIDLSRDKMIKLFGA
jgi:hypothetical protein